MAILLRCHSVEEREKERGANEYETHGNVSELFFQLNFRYIRVYININKDRKPIKFPVFFLVVAAYPAIFT